VDKTGALITAFPAAVEAAAEIAEKFPRGETKSNSGFIEHGPEHCAERVLKHRATSLVEEVASTVAFYTSERLFESDEAKLELFLDALVKAKVMSRAEADARQRERSDSVRSKLKKIAEHEAVILHPEIRQYLKPGYTRLYEIALLYEDLKEKYEDAIDRLSGIIKRSDGQPSRAYVESERKKLRGTYSPVPTAGLGGDQSDQNTQIAANRLDRRITDDATSPSGQLESHENAEAMISALFVTPDDRDASRVSKVNIMREPACFRPGAKVGDHAVLILRAKLRNVLPVASRLEWCGCTRLVGFYLLTRPEGPEVKDLEAIAIYVKGNPQINLFSDWPTQDDPDELTNCLLQNVSGRRVHLFAKSEMPGWESVVGEANRPAED
jgi:hypothetical protein